MLAANSLLQDRYRVIRQLGSGGMGAVYEAIDQRVNCLVSVKETFGTSEEARRAFEREASLLANLRHPSLPRVMDHFTENDCQYLVMDHIAGHDLAELLKLRGRAFDIEEVLRFGDTILGILEYLHGRQPPILHRDIKPANIKQTDDGQIYLIDFGLAKGAAGEMPTSMQTSRSVVGYTPVYSSLEQIYGQGTDPRSDLYALAATIYHLMTGVVPIDAPTRFMAVDEDQPDPMLNAPAWGAHPNSNVVRVITRGLALRRKERIGSATEFRRELNEAAVADKSMRSAETVILNDQQFVTTPPGPQEAAPTVLSHDTPYQQGGGGAPPTMPLDPNYGSSTGGGGGPVPLYGAKDTTPHEDLRSQSKPARSRVKRAILLPLLLLVILGGAFGIVYAFFWDDLTRSTGYQGPVIASTPTPTPTPEPYRGPTFELVSIPAGTFTMGTASDERDNDNDEQPQHTVTLSHNFLMSKYEVTQAQWQTVMGNNPANFSGCGNCPVESVTWNEVQDFIRKLNALASQQYVYRLPTEAEWEYACRAGTTTPFSFGNSISSDEVNFKASEPYLTSDPKGEFREKPVPVGTFTANAWGLYDMHGNVYEWVSDWYNANYFTNSAPTDPTGPDTGTNRVFRGGSWNSAAKYVRSGYRGVGDPAKKYDNCGFRLAAVKKST